MLSIEIDIKWFVRRIYETAEQRVGGVKNAIETSCPIIVEDWENWVKNGYCRIWL